MPDMLSFSTETPPHLEQVKRMDMESPGFEVAAQYSYFGCSMAQRVS